MEAGEKIMDKTRTGSLSPVSSLFPPGDRGLGTLERRYLQKSVHGLKPDCLDYLCVSLILGHFIPSAVETIELLIEPASQSVT